MKQIKFFLIALFSLVATISCVNKTSKNTVATETKDSLAQIESTAAQSIPAEFTPLTFTGDIKGENTNKHEVKIDAEGTYIVEAQSANTGLTFVLQDKDGNNVVDESSNPKWTGSLKQGTYTAIVGLTRNAARKANASASYTLTIKK